ncbi:MAG TPA: ELWxxDGT repeat protein, partial [Phnomibacter sp.]|nr:ELWxxDGT repeat protein [Phnomibacter sp.]
MKKVLPLFPFAFILFLSAQAQVTQINNNGSLEPLTPINETVLLLRSAIDGHLWVTQGTPGTTVKINNTISAGSGGVLFNGKFIFAGTHTSTGSELYITDGTTLGTVLLKDIIAGEPGSFPDDFTVFNGHVYFSAATEASGRELWRTDGTANGTVMVKDINPGAGSSNLPGEYNFTQADNTLYFVSNGGSAGKELWKTNGTQEGTVMVKDINTGDGSSDPQYLWPLGNVLLFVARTTANGREVWRSDGTEGGTFLLKDIIEGPISSTELEIAPGFAFPITNGFHLFGNRAFFLASDGMNLGNIYETDGTTANTKLLKTVVSGFSMPLVPIVLSVNMPGKFFFTVADAESRAEVWVSDGTPNGTTLFKSFFAV